MFSSSAASAGKCRIHSKAAKSLPHVGKVARAARRMRRRVVRSELLLRLHNAKAPLGDQGELSLKATEGIRTLQVLERHPVVRQNEHLLIPSVTASPCHRLAAARSRRGSDSPPGCHGAPRRRFATLVTKGRLENAETWRQLRTYPPLPPHQSPTATASPQGEAVFCAKSSPPPGGLLFIPLTSRIRPLWSRG